MSVLTDEQLESLARQLDAREQQLRAEVRGAREEAQLQQEIDAGVVGDTGDVGQAKTRDDIGHAEMERDVEELMEIDGAKQRIADGSYGECVDCTQEIGYPRLQVQPAAKRCTECQERFERMQSTTASPAARI